MLRILMALAVWALLMGGVGLYMERREMTGTAPEYIRPEAPGVYALEVTTSFVVEPDPFAVQLDESQAPAALVLRMGKQELIRRAEKLEAGEGVKVERVEGLVVGRNEFFIEANPPTEQIQRAHAVRVRITRDGAPVADRTFWTEPGAKLAAAFELEIVAGEGKNVEHERHR